MLPLPLPDPCGTTGTMRHGDGCAKQVATPLYTVAKEGKNFAKIAILGHIT